MYLHTTRSHQLHPQHDLSLTLAELPLTKWPEQYVTPATGHGLL